MRRWRKREGRGGRLSLLLVEKTTGGGVEGDTCISYGLNKGNRGMSSRGVERGVKKNIGVTKARGNHS
ncbi:unnamed protein product [Cochlearia groenlandica]